MPQDQLFSRLTQIQQALILSAHCQPAPIRYILRISITLLLIIQVLYSLQLQLRAELANMVGADLFVSIHFNAGPPGDSRIHGTEIMTFPLAGQRSDQSWNDRINDKEAYAAPVNRFDMWSEILAGCIHRDVLAALGTAKAANTRLGVA